MSAYSSSRYAYEGTETTETSITRVGGASDPTGQAQSRKIVTTANSQWLRPFKAEPYAIWNPTAGANVTVTVCGTVNAGVLPNNDDIWIETEYLSLISAGPLATFDGIPSANVVMSNGNLTVTHGGTGNGAGVSSLTVLATGKYYFEITTQTVLSNAEGFGVGQFFTGTFNDISGAATNGVGVAFGSTTIVYSNGVNTGKNLGTTVVGDVFGAAIDLTNRLAWFRRNSGNWNADATADPVTGVGGVSIPAGAIAPYVRFGSGVATEALTANFGQSSFVNTAPSGFGNWSTPAAPLGTIVTTTKANVLAANAVVASDGSSWNNAVPTNIVFDLASAVNATLSNGNLTVTHSNTTGNSGAQVLSAQSSGKWYFEVTQATTGHGALDAIAALIPAGSGFGGFVITGPTIGVSVFRAGAINANNASTGINIGAFSAGDVCGVAVDFNAGLFWSRKNAGSWNNSGTANPATGVGGIPINLPASLAPTVGFTGTSTAAGDSYTANFGATAYANAAPSGFNNWIAWSPFKLTTTLSAPQPGLAGIIEARVRVAKPSAIFYIDPQIALTPAGGGSSNALTAYKSSRYQYEGTETTETSITRVGGASDPTGQAQSRRIVTTANSQWLRPFKAEPYAIWNPTSGANVTVTVCGTINAGALPNNDDIWLEVEYLGDGPSTVFATFDGTNTNVTLSNGNLTATHNSAVTNSGATSTMLLATGKHYFEVTIGATHGNNDSVALVTSGTSFASIISGQNGIVAFAGASGLIFNVGSSTGKTVGTWVAGDVICFAADATNGKAWVRRNNGNWNGDPTADPAAGTGYIGSGTTGGAAVAPNITFGGTGTALNDNMTANFGKSAFAFTPPSGFNNNWSVPYAGSPLGTIVATTKANVLAAGSAVASDGSTWTTPPFTVLNPSDILSGTLSNGFLTATGSGNGGVRGTNSLSSGKYYWEYTYTNLNTNTIAAGIALASAGLTAGGPGAAFASRATGTIVINNVTTGSVLGLIPAAAVIGIAVDFTNQLIWFRIAPSGNWNGSGTANPATGTGGLSINSISSGPLYPLCMWGVGDVLTANFGASAFTGSVPSGFTAGFSGSGIWSPFKLTTTLSAPQPGLAGYLEARVRAAKPSTTFYLDPRPVLS